jgi:hypothetical protein
VITYGQYASAHIAVSKARGKPAECVDCGLTGPENGPYEWANLTGDYTNVYDYRRMCRSCHRKFDKGRRDATGEPTTPWRYGDSRTWTRDRLLQAADEPPIVPRGGRGHRSRTMGRPRVFKTDFNKVMEDHMKTLGR